MIIGADPGQNGGLATYCPVTSAVAVFRMPKKSAGLKSAPDRERLDTTALFQICQLLFGLGVEFAMLERVQGYGGQGAASAFTFGKVTGILEACLVAAGIEVREVAPCVWKPRLQVYGDKTAARLRASQLMPSGAPLWPRVKDDGLAEAALLAYYGNKWGRV